MIYIINIILIKKRDNGTRQFKGQIQVRCKERRIPRHRRRIGKVQNVSDSILRNKIGGRRKNEVSIIHGSNCGK